jgi:hypothetical protein
MRPVRFEALKRQFPAAASLPPLLASFLEWRNAWQEGNPAEDLRQYLSFDLGADSQTLTRWFGDAAEDPEEMLSQLAVFAQDAEGSLLAFWLRDGEPVEAAPIVVLHAEGIPDSHVAATSLVEFLQLIAGTDTEIARLQSREQSQKQVTVLNDFRHWLSEVAGIQPLRTAGEAVQIEKRAQASEEAFQAWIHAE